MLQPDDARGQHDEAHPFLNTALPGEEGGGGERQAQRQEAT